MTKAPKSWLERSRARVLGIQGVRYDELTQMLQNEVPKQQQVIAAERQHATARDAEVDALKAQLAEIHAALTALEIKDQPVERR